MMLRLPVLLAALLGLAAPALAGPLVEFSGHSWMLRDYPGGPGPNQWSPDLAWVEPDGLHLRVAPIDGVWHSAEAVMTTPLGFGRYQFEVEGAVGALDPNIVLGLFNYPGSSEVGPDGTNEIDIEFAQWGKAGQKHRLNWTVYPPAAGPKRAHASAPFAPASSVTTHRFEWTPTSVRYASFDGPADKADDPLAQWTYAPASPQRHVPQQPLVVHMNLWLFEGRPPLDGKPAEIVIRSFSFTPAGQ